MTRVKRGTTANKKREKVLKKTKGFAWGRKSKERAAKEALLHSESRAFRGRKEKKRVYRNLWQNKIGAAVKENGLSYSKFAGLLKKADILIDRKMLADLAEKEPEIFKQIIEKAKEAEADTAPKK